MKTAHGFRLSAIVPTLNEAAWLAGCLSGLAEQDRLGEILVVDGGSTDATRALVRESQRTWRGAGIGLRWLEARPGRGVQLNAGAAAANEEALIFLHADTVLPRGGVAAAAEAISAGFVGGAFTHRFLETDPRLRVISWYANTRSRLSHVFFGDQGIFVGRDVFESLGGFNALPIMEDLEFSGRLRRAGPTALLPLPVRTSGRRFLAQGIARTCVKMMWLRAAYHAGADPAGLARRYREVR
ncbi:MAG TPA: TIGR04283 family arsenosugar biosynthesis glycosyltransferase [Candidatus Polarisedimenticolia bacterium]|nr:TIGR04283 family arsenosugar biosynthesis glycosyltransferase [Candidatus Polarisedimenticolia bacterium]